MIFIGVVLRGPELSESEISSELRKAMLVSVQARGAFKLGSEPSINVIFYVPGSQGVPDWEGLRDGRYSARQKLLMVQVAVPAEVISSSSARQFIVDALHRANAIAFEFFREKELFYQLGKAARIVDTVRDKLIQEGRS